MMRMTVRQIRAYLDASIPIRAREALEGSVVAGLHTLSPQSSASILAIWRQLAGEATEKRVVDGQVVEVLGDWKVVRKDKLADFFNRKG